MNMNPQLLHRTVRLGYAGLALTLALGLSLQASAGTLYRWVDARGVVNYSSEPPPAGAKVQAVTEQPVSSYDTSAALAATERQNRELQARLDRMQREVDELKARAATPTVVYAPAPAAQPAAQKTAVAACADDPRNNCSRGIAPEFEYPNSGVVVRTVPVFVPVYPSRPGLPVTTPGTPRPPHHHSSPPQNGSFGGNRSGLSLSIRYGG
jgi:hypothetical protein